MAAVHPCKTDGVRTRVLTVLVPVVAAALLLTGCTGGDQGGSSQDVKPRLVAAQKIIDDAASLNVSIAADEVPDGVSGLKSATGVGTHAPAFQGKVSIASGGSTLSADVIAVDGKVWAKLGFSPKYLTISPATLQAPDPALLLGGKGGGLASILTETTGAKQGKKSRDGKTVLTSITGTLKGSVVHRFLPTADESGSFAVTYRLDDDDVLRDATIKGPFYEGSPDVTYRVKLTASDQDVTITAPNAAGGR